jgi:hypothetical protein
MDDLSAAASAQALEAGAVVAAAAAVAGAADQGGQQEQPGRVGGAHGVLQGDRSVAAQHG